MQDTYLNAYVLRGILAYNQGQYDTAIKDFEQALNYPVERFGRSRWAQFHYLIGTVYEATGESEKAKNAYEQTLTIALENRGSDRQYLYYHGQAYKKLGKSAESEKVFQEMLDMTQRQSESTFFRQFEGGGSQDSRLADNHYLAGLANQGLGQTKAAREEFTKALELDPGHVWAKQHLAMLEEEE